LSGRPLRLNSTITVSTDRVAFVSVNHGCLIGSLKSFGTWPRYTWRHGSVYLSLLRKQPHPNPFHRCLESHFVVWPYTNPRHYLPPPTPLCIVNLAFHANASLLRSVRRLLITANFVPSSPILVTLMMEALRSSETSEMSVLTRARRRNIIEDDIPDFFLSEYVETMGIVFTYPLRNFHSSSNSDCACSTTGNNGSDSNSNTPINTS
jgi:hypothetical protein